MRVIAIALLVILSSIVRPQDVDIIQLIQNTGIDKYSNITFQSVEKHPELDDVKNYFFDTKDCRCFEGGLYFVGLRDVGAKNLIVNLQGGGACWPGFFECKEDVGIGEFESVDEDLNKPDTAPSWNTTFIPYCDGSNYLGDNVVDYDEDGITDHSHWGIRHLSAGLNLARSELEDPDKILITGCSAGGYGTFSAMLLARLKFPNARIYVLNESGPGMTDANKNGIWDLVRENWGMQEWMPNQFDDSQGSLLPLYSWMLAYDPLIKVAVFSSYKDAVLANEFLEIPGNEFKNRLLKDSEIIQQKFPDRFKRFFVKGDSHCVEDYLYEIDGISYVDWVRHFVNDGTGWVDIME